jgi:Tol biopolymer transport system component
MKRPTRERRTSRRMLSIIATMGLVAGMLAIVASPVGAKVAGANGQIAFDTGDDNRIVIANPDGTHAHELDLPYPAFMPVWSPNGMRILVNVFGPDGVARPATVDPDGSDFTLLEVPEAAEDFDIICRAWSPDGTQLLCPGQRFEGDHSMDGIYTIRASDGGDLTRLTTHHGYDPGDYSPDGTRFVFERSKPNARHQLAALFVANADGTGLRQITPFGTANPHDDGVASWSPDGSEILFASEHGSLFVVRPDGTGVRQIRIDTGGGSSFAFTPGWSPDGTSIVFSLDLFLGNTGQEDIYTARADGSQVAQVTDTPGFEHLPDWGPHPLAT